MKRKPALKIKTRVAALRQSKGRKRTKKYAAVSDFIKSFSLNLAIIALVMGMNWPGLFAIGRTLAYYNDTETSSDNAHIAGSLDFSLSAVSDFTPEVTPDDDALRSAEVLNEGSLGFQYRVKSQNFSGNLDLCNALDLEADLDGNNEYSGALTAFNIASFEFSDPESWNFTTSLNSDDLGLQETSCSFDILFKGWQIDVAEDSGGFTDEEVISNMVTAGEWEVDSCVTDPGDIISTVMTGSSFGTNGHNLIVASGGELKSPTSGGSNGIIVVSTDCDVTVQSGGKITAVKGDGTGGAMTISARNFTVDVGGIVSASSTASGKKGGSIDLTTINDIAINGAVSANGHDNGGDIIATAGGDVSVGGSSLTATSVNKNGGDILLTATGDIDVPGLISTSAKDFGGTITFLASGDLTVPFGGSVLAESANKEGGRIEAVIDGAGDISGTLSVDGKDGDGLVAMTLQGNMTVGGTGLISANSTNPSGKDGGTIGIKVGGNALYSGTVQANATKNAKSIALWSEGSTAIGGTAGEMVSAIGGTGGGDKGGVIDITTRADLSGDGTIDASGTVNGSIIERTVTNSIAGIATPAATTQSITLNNIVLNEIIPDPVGSDEGSLVLPLDGEWMELYNKSGAAVDVNNWVLKDADGNTLTITSARGDNDGDLSDAGETIVPALGTLTVYRNGGGLTLNDDGDTVQLLTDTSVLVDSFTYVVDVGSGNSIARMPDGIGAWVDPEPTPTALNGGINISKLKQEFLKRLKAAIVEEAIVEEPIVEEEEVLPAEENSEASEEASEPIVEEPIVEAVIPEEEIATEPEAVETPAPEPEEIVAEEPPPEETPPAEPEPVSEPVTIPEETNI